MTTRAQVSPFPVVQLVVVALFIGATVPYYGEAPALESFTLGTFILETVLFVLGFWPWLLAHPVNLVLAAPMLLYVLLLFSRPVVRAKRL